MRRNIKNRVHKHFSFQQKMCASFPPQIVITKNITDRTTQFLIVICSISHAPTLPIKQKIPRINNIQPINSTTLIFFFVFIMSPFRISRYSGLSTPRLFGNRIVSLSIVSPPIYICSPGKSHLRTQSRDRCSPGRRIRSTCRIDGASSCVSDF